MQLTASNSRNFILILYNASNGAEKLWLVRSLSRKLPWAACALKAEELQQNLEKQSDLHIDNSSVNAATASAVLRFHLSHRLLIGVSYGQFWHKSCQRDQSRGVGGGGGGGVQNVFQDSGKTNKGVNILLLKRTPSTCPSAGTIDLCDCGLKGIFFSSWSAPQIIFVWLLLSIQNWQCCQACKISEYLKAWIKGFWYSSVIWQG